MLILRREAESRAGVSRQQTAMPNEASECRLWWIAKANPPLTSLSKKENCFDVSPNNSVTPAMR